MGPHFEDDFFRYKNMKNTRVNLVVIAKYLMSEILAGHQREPFPIAEQNTQNGQCSKQQYMELMAAQCKIWHSCATPL